MNRFLVGTCVIFISLAMIVSCQTAPKAPPPEISIQATETVIETSGSLPIIITDALGRQVVFEELPQRIVIAGKATSLILDAFYMFPEASTRIIAYENRSQNGTNFMETVDPTAAAKNVILQDASAEQILPFQPDLVVLKYYMKEQLGDELEAVGIQVFYMDMETPEKFLDEIASIGEILGNPQRGDEIILAYQTMLAEVEDQISSLKTDQMPSVLLLQYSDKSGAVAFNIPPQEWLQTTMTEMAGGDPVWMDAAQSSGWAQINLEQIAAWDPDFIFIIYYQGDSADIVSQLLQDPVWQDLRAFREGEKIYGFPSDFMSWDQPDTRWILGYTFLAVFLHPDLIEGQVLLNSIYSFYEIMYGFSFEKTDSVVFPILKGDLP